MRRGECIADEDVAEFRQGCCKLQIVLLFAFVEPQVF